jgi:two-component system nitrate/nitrite response regulator NarL
MKKLLFVGGRLPRERAWDALSGSILTLVGEAGTLAEAHRLLCGAHGEAERPDILLVDIHDSLDGDEAEMLGAIRGRQPAAKIIVLGNPMSLALLWQACSTAIDGYLLHTVPPAMLMHALDLILSGQRILPPSSHAARAAAHAAAKAPAGATATNGLSTREAQILRLLVAGWSNKAIARDLTISHETVKVHIRALLRKLKARNRTQAALWGLENGYRKLGCLLLCLIPGLIPGVDDLAAPCEGGPLGLFSAVAGATAWIA